MIRPSDIDKIVCRHARRSEGGIGEWCKRNDVDEDAIERIVQIYGFDRGSAIAAIDAFRVGHQARREDEPRGELSASGPRYAVQMVVVDSRSGRIVGDASSAMDHLEGLAAAYNELEPRQPTADSQR
jgi:hypothetical protein